jgi:hypothetical protein
MRSTTIRALGATLAIAFGVLAAAQDGSVGSPSANLPDDASSLLGLTVAEAFARFGAPESVSAVRGDQAWQDDVVFAYKQGFHLVFYRDRVWQVRLTSSYKGSVYGFFMGDPISKVVSLLGAPTYTLETTLVWNRPNKSFPIRLRLETVDGAVTDAYVYRADF